MILATQRVSSAHFFLLFLSYFFQLIIHHAAEQLRQLFTRNLVRCFKYVYEPALQVDPLNSIFVSTFIALESVLD